MQVEDMDRLFSQYQPYTGEPSLILDLEKSKGSFFWDSRTQRSYLDFATHFAALPLGYNHPSLARNGFKDKLLKAALHKVANLDYYSDLYAEFLSKFVQEAGLPGFQHFFFIDGGALAVENALKTAFDWKTRKNLAAGILQEANSIIHFKEAFHGRSGYTLSLTNSYKKNVTEFFPKFSWPRIHNPKCQFPLSAAEEERIILEEKTAEAEIREALKANPNGIAALIIEPIQAEGGDNHFRGSFLKTLRQICDRYELLLIFDEVQSGMGLTGKMWCCQHFDVLPDILVFGKKAQICGIQASDRLDEVENVFVVPGRISSTFGGTLVDMVRCQWILETIKQENLLENAAIQGKRCLSQLQAIAEKNSTISQVRGRGLMIAFDLETATQRNFFLNQVREAGLLLLPCGAKSVRLRSPLNVKPEEIDLACAAIAQSLK